MDKNYIAYKVLDEITYPFSHWNGVAVGPLEVWWIKWDVGCNAMKPTHYICSITLLTRLFDNDNGNDNGYVFIAMEYIYERYNKSYTQAFILVVVIWHIIHQNCTWQTGLEAVAYVLVLESDSETSIERWLQLLQCGLWIASAYIFNDNLIVSITMLKTVLGKVIQHCGIALNHG